MKNVVFFSSVNDLISEDARDSEVTKLIEGYVNELEELRYM